MSPKNTEFCVARVSGPYLEKKMVGGGGANTDRVAKGHCEGEGAGGCAPSCAEREAETTSILQSEWEAKKRSINNICTCTAAVSMEKNFFLSRSGGGGGGGGQPPPPPP